ncbi:CASP-like protein 1B1 [Apium graveolens]|uniref:CASP-like protein 1B1 n=1 Tax=Apium graveolens TaxID=4045 RepID=UPI003D7A3DA1
MAAESGEKTEVECKSNEEIAVTRKPMRYVIPVLRLLAFAATLSATLVMALNKQTNTFVVATVGTTPIKATFTAKFNHAPAFVFFVIANAIASCHSILMLVVELFGYKYDLKGLRFAIIPILDIFTVALISGGANAAAFMGEVGRNGNSHARWNKTCDKFKKYCDHGSAAMLLSFIGVLILITITSISILKLRKRNSTNYSTLH